ncbi:amidohydrolase [Allorhizobium terrae]|uniref:Amidohydrolase n=1 Tax=Allorhizobium terrae TaxID=1848972 RepID=A0A4V3W971_9HYPH|nr:amidohydrolase [Allorhizobium terrae]THF54077.1 amidohydrolase [Allorhizobium terrae]
MTEAASIVIKNGRVLTMDADTPKASALAIRDNRIVAVGDWDDVSGYVGDTTRIIDAGEGTVMPGFNEGHMHIFGGSVSLVRLDVYGLKGFEVLKAAVRDYANANPDLKMLIGNGADYGVMETKRLDRHDLDAIISDRPLILFSFDHHIAWANTLALEQAGLLQGRDVGLGNEVVMGPDGLATGELREANAFGPVVALSDSGGRDMLGVATGGDPENVSDEERKTDIALIKRGLAYCASLGITSIQNMDGSLYQLEILEEIKNTDGLPCRVRMPFHMKNFMPLSDVQDKAVAWRARFNDDQLRSDFIKLFMDGVIEGETAHMSGGYAHKPGLNCDPLFSQEAFDAIAIEATKEGLPIAVHAIGDGAVNMVLNGYEAGIKATGNTAIRHRIEHIEVVLPTDIPRFKELGVVASMQPPHPPGTGLLPLRPCIDYIGRERWPYSYAWRTLVDAGAKMVFATDWPVSPLDPMLSIEQAMTRQKWADDLQDQRLSLQETLEAYTINGAYVESMEDRKGILKTGYLADVVVLNGDVEAVPFDALSQVRPVVTICDGQVTFEA